MKFTDEFRALLTIREDANGDAGDAKERVIGAVMQRIEQSAAQPESVVGVIERVAWPVMVTSVVAASIVLAVSSRFQGSPSVPLNPPSTAQAVGLPVDFARWTERRDGQPQLFELMTAASLSSR